MFALKLPLSSLLLFVLLTFVAFAQKAPNFSTKQTPFPKARQVSKTWSYRSAKAHGNVTYPDPYFWMERPYTTDKEVQQFAANQQAFTEKYMSKCTNANAIDKSIRDAYDFNDYFGFTFMDDQKNPFYFFSLKRIGENRKTYYIATPAEFEAASKTNFANPPGRKFFDENALSVDGTASLSTYYFSLDSKYFAYLVTEADASVGTWYIRETSSPLLKASKTPGGDGRLPEAIPRCDGSLMWKPDSSGFYYTQVNDPKGGTNTDIGSVARFHKVGTAYEKDILIVHADPSQDSFYTLYESLDGQWLILINSQGTGEAAVYATRPLEQPLSDKMKWISLAPAKEDIIYSIAIVGNTFYAQSDHDAPNGKVVKYEMDWSKARSVSKLQDLKDKVNPIDVIPARANAQMTFSLVLDNDKVVLVMTENGKYVLYLYSLLTGKLIQPILPEETFTIHEVYYADSGSKHMMVTYWGPYSPRKSVQIGWDGTKIVATTFFVETVKGVAPGDYITEQLQATSKDGTKVPFFAVYNKNTKLDGTAPVIMHFAGAYGIIENLFWYPLHFSIMRLYGAVIVYAGVRGGGDKGNEWRIAGERLNRQNTFDDIIAVAQDLVKRKIAGPGKVIAEGQGAGGTFAAVVGRQAPPNTFGAILSDIAPTDWFLISRGIAGSSQVADFGDPNNATEFDVIRSWSPLQNIDPTKQKVFPPILLTPSDSDQYTAPAHAFKYIAQLQNSYPNSPNPFLMHLQKNAGGNAVDGNQATLIKKAFHQQCFVQLALGLTQRV
ncbi:prolyl oligopeptidase [Meira miltonrushii]|uniref:Prolyl endopeptidase n=1 Tax=Meira miltonrushii TaxID=1280837 RepID=A0A316VKG4_9BASI|nr:prolyl oligopeptidase [Meira miltonrushii]PWN36823.1 prolyl oligopeptidase [Meira miltonrushii]